MCNIPAWTDEIFQTFIDNIPFVCIIQNYYQSCFIFIATNNFLLYQSQHIIYFALFSMHFCRDQEQANDTQCCLFNSTTHHHKQTKRVFQDGLVGIQRPRISYKPDQTTQKLARLIFKNEKGENSQEKEKISLSKKSGRRPGTYSHDHSEKKQQQANISGSNASVRKLKPPESKPNSSVLNVDFSFNQLIPQTGNNQPQAKISFSNIPSSQHPLQLKYPATDAKSQNKVFQRSLLNPAPLPSIPLSYRASKNINFQYISQPEYFCSPPNIPIKPQSQSHQIYNQNKLMPIQEPIMVSSTHNNSQLNAYSVENINIKGVQTTAPTMQTDRNMVYSQVKEGNQQLLPLKNNSHIFTRQESQYAESRMVETVSPDLGRTHLKTVQSVYGSEMGKKQMQQSIIVIDFFNPSEHLRKEIEDKIFNQRYPENYP